jgi:hypothetical protein
MSNRLGNDDYKKPKQTYQDKLTKEEQEEMLIGYKEIDSLEQLKTLQLGTEIRYYSFIKDQKTGKVEKKFRMGGRLINKDNADKYIVCATGTPPNQKSWTVQVKDAEIYYKLKVEDVIEKQGEFVKEATKDLEDKYLNEIKDLKEELKKSKKETRDLKVMYNTLVDKYDALKKGPTKK